MGNLCQCDTQQKQYKQSFEIFSKEKLKIATLNYSGIMNNPFEFYCDEPIIRKKLQQVSQIFKKLISEYFQDANQKQFQWTGGKVDQAVRNRYSPFFKQDAGIDQHGKLQTHQQFNKTWTEVFENCEKEYLQKKGQKINPLEKQNVQIFDFLIYHTLIKYTYEGQGREFSKNDMNTKAIKQLNPEKYQNNMKEFFSLSYLKFETKLSKLKERLQLSQLDVLFLQQYDKGIQQYAYNDQKYFVQKDQENDQLILAKKQSFQSKSHKNMETIFKQIIGGEWQKYMKERWKFAQRKVVFMAVDKLIFIGLHLSSKAQQNEGQVKDLKLQLAYFQSKAKAHQYDVIVGGDLNSFVSFDTDVLHFYPQKKEIYTTKKKRTFAQAQYKKADKQVEQSKDKIISTLPLLEAKTTFIDGRQTSKQSIVPSNEHPFDHFLVMAKVKIPQ